MSEWKSIESAPKDGTEILVYVGQSGFYSKGIVVAYWDNGTWRSTFCADHYAFKDEESVLFWMPLPPTPLDNNTANRSNMSNIEPLPPAPIGSDDLPEIQIPSIGDDSLSWEKRAEEFFKSLENIPQTQKSPLDK